jgi:hypothetical protein
VCTPGTEGGEHLTSQVCRGRADCWSLQGRLLSQTPALLLTSPHTLRTSGVFPASAVAQGSQLLVHSVDRMVNTTFICTATNAVGTGRAEQVILVRGKEALWCLSLKPSGFSLWGLGPLWGVTDAALG